MTSASITLTHWGRAQSSVLGRWRATRSTPTLLSSWPKARSCSVFSPHGSPRRVNLSIVLPEGARAEENAAGLQERPRCRCCDAGESGAVTRSPWHSYLSFPRTPIKAATLYVHVSGRGRRDSWERRANRFAFLCKGWEGALAGERRRPQDN